MDQFKKLNRFIGIGVGVFATLIYALTMESTTSLWDCGEFIAASYKQEVVHPPGAPLFLMIGRIFTIIPDLLGKTEWIAPSMNFMSALSSGLAIMLLFWIITHFATKLIRNEEEEWNNTSTYLAIGAGLIGALTGTFLDTIWFSAVEAEVYSMSLLTTALVFWLICRWERKADEPYADRYLILIAFFMGCSIFIHWLNLLSIPAIALTYYFKRYEAKPLGIFLTLVASGFILILFLNGVITGVVDFIASIELMMVNNLGMPFNSGVIVAILIIIAAITLGLFFTYRKGWVTAYNGIVAFIFILIGFSTLTAVPIRSNAFTPIDMNSPRDIISLSSYLHRDQYGTRPLAFGYFYNEKPNDIKNTGYRYGKNKDTGKYDVVGRKFEYIYPASANRIFFPRLHSTAHVGLYEQWLGLRKNERPTYSDNIRFFFKYQIGHMYLRYFAWNFIGRQNDAQGTVTARDGNWISGVPFIENPRAPKQRMLPDGFKNHPYRNTFYYLPFLLGLLGLIFQALKDKKSFVVITFLFLMTGVVLIIYGNSPPIEPRERDYIFAASFWAFSIWVGLGMVALYSLLKPLNGVPRVAASFALCLIVPLLMGFQGWDEHDRSGRYTARDYAANYLNSCAPNAILFTQGDNDTYPLWYAQEVEGIRTDVHVVNLSLLGVDWYINQKRHKVNNAAAVPMTLEPEDIRGGQRDQVVFNDQTKMSKSNEHMNLVDIMKFIADESNQRTTVSGEAVSFYPTKKLKLPLPSKKALIENGTVNRKDEGRIVSEMNFDLGNKRRLLKNDLMVLDIIAANAANGWSRPIYFAVSVDRNSYMGLQDYFQLEGLAYRLVPIKSTPDPNRPTPFYGSVDTDIMYENLMNKFRFGNLEKEGIFLSTDVGRMASNFRSNYIHLAESLIQENKLDKAVEVLDRCREIFTDKANNPMSLFSYRLPIAYYLAEANEQGNEVTEEIIKNLSQEINYYNSMSQKELKRLGLSSTIKTYQSVIGQMLAVAKQSGQDEFVSRIRQDYGL